MLSQIFINKKLKELTITSQSFFKTSLMAPQQLDDLGQPSLPENYIKNDTLLSEEEENQIF